MTCDEARALFSAYYDGKLEPGEREDFEAHSRECPVCAADYQSFLATMRDLHTLPEPTPPPGFHRLLMRRVSALRPRVPYRVYAQAAGWAAACFIVLSAAVAGISGITESIGLRGGSGGSLAFEAAYDADGAKAATVNGVSAGSGIVETTAASAVTADVPANPYGRTAFADDMSLTLAAGYFEQTFNIHITVPDLDSAAAAVDGLNGYNLNADKRYDGSGGGYGSYRRRVDVAAYAGVKETLRALGEVTDESENVIRHADDVFDLEARLTAKEEECKRLTELLRQSRTMDVLVAVEQQLGMAESEREDLRGRLNQLYDLSARAYINITLYERPPEPVALPDDTFAERLRERFIRSMNGFIVFVEQVMVLISGAFVPLTVAAVFAALGYAAYRRRRAKAAPSGEEPDDE